MSSRRPVDPPEQLTTQPVASGTPRPVQAFAMYTSMRLVVFVVALGVLYALHFRSFALVVGALLVSGIVSYLLLRRQRDTVARALLTREPRAVRRGASRPTRAGETAVSASVTDDLYEDDDDPYADDEPSAAAGPDTPAAGGAHPAPRH